MNPPLLHRAFLCIPLPESVRRSLASVQSRLKAEGHALAFSRVEWAHITLIFLGEVASSAVDRLIARMDEIGRALAPFILTVGGGGYFGSTRSPKVIWAGVSLSPDLKNLQSRLVQAAEVAGIPVEPRPFHPHLTIARNRSCLSPGALTSIIPCINNTPFDEVPVNRVLFMNSLLNGSGSRYTTIHQIYLKGQQHG